MRFISELDNHHDLIYIHEIVVVIIGLENTYLGHLIPGGRASIRA